MHEQGIAWMVARGHHDPSPEELRYRELRRALTLTRPPRATLREWVGAIVAGPASATVTDPTPDCCPA